MKTSPPVIDALNAAYHAQVALLFSVLCTALDTGIDERDAEARFHRGMIHAQRAYQIANNAEAMS